MHRRKPLKSKSRLRRVGKRKLAEQEELSAFRTEVLERAGWRCERCGSERNLHAHHRLPKGRCGSNDARNGHCLCSWCHIEGVHGHHAEDWKDWIETKKAQEPKPPGPPKESERESYP